MKVRDQTNLSTWFPTEFLALGIAEIIVRIERCVQGGNEIEQGLCRNGVTQVTFHFITVTVLSVTKEMFYLTTHFFKLYAIG